MDRRSQAIEVSLACSATETKVRINQGEQLGPLSTEDVNGNPTLTTNPAQHDPTVPVPTPSSTGSSRRISLGSPSVMVVYSPQRFPGFIRRTDNNHMDAEGIAQVVELLKEYDKNKVNNCNGDIDSLLILVRAIPACILPFKC